MSNNRAVDFVDDAYKQSTFVMLSLAAKNVTRHTAHSFLLSLLFALSAFLFILGNSLLVHSNSVLRDLFITTITGDFAVAAQSDHSLSIFGANTPAIGELIHIPVLKQKEELIQAVTALPGVEAAAPIVSGIAELKAAGRRRIVPVFGIEPGSYFTVLEALEIVDGRALKENERGVMLTQAQVERFSQEKGKSLEIGDEVLFTTAENQRFRIRAVPLVGVFRYPVSMDYVNEIALVDAATVRDLNSIQNRIIDENVKAGGPRRASEIDSLFSEPEGGETAGQESGEQAGLSVGEVVKELGESREKVPAAVEGAVHFILIRGNPSDSVRRITDAFHADILSWREAAGRTALLAFLLQILFNSGFVLFIISVTLGAINMLLVSTYRRTREIATLRAIGADDRTVSLLIMTEHLFIGVLGWFVGLISALGAAATAERMDIGIRNNLLAMLLGGEILRIPMDAGTIFISLALVVGIVGAAVSVPLAHILRKPIVESIRVT